MERTLKSVFTELATLASRFPDFDAMVNSVSGVRSATLDAVAHFQYTELSGRCKSEIMLLLETTQETIGAIYNISMILSTHSAHAVYQFAELNNRLSHNPSKIPAIYKTELYKLRSILQKLEKYSHIH